ncbi:MAG TPA: response regulator [Sphingobium sp.]|nr:response regulator [Sphingobium sp.]
MTAGHPLRVLVVEDEAMIGLMLEDFLEVLGHEMAGLCTSVSDCEAALDAGVSIDVAILDCNLPDGAIWPVARRMRGCAIPIIFASGDDGYGTPDDLAAIPTLAKPFSLDALERVLAALLEA